MDVRRKLRLAAAAGLAAGSAACVLPDDVARMQKDLADVRQQLRQAQ